MAIYTVHEAKTTLSRLIQQVLDGEEVIIARGKEPVVRLVPLKPKPKLPNRGFGMWRGTMPDVPPEVFAPMSDEELAEWEQPIFGLEPEAPPEPPEHDEEPPR